MSRTVLTGCLASICSTCTEGLREYMRTRCFGKSFTKHVCYLVDTLDTLEEEVKKLSKSALKTSKSILQIVSTTLENTPWWHERLQEYLAKSAATVDKRESIMKMQRDLTAMVEVTQGSTQSLIEMLQAVPTFLTITRQGSCTVFVETLEKKCGMLWAHITGAEKHTWQTSVIDEFLKLFAEAASVWPFEAKYHDYLTQLANMKEASYQQQVINDFMTAAMALKQIPKEESSQFAEQLTQLSQKLQSSSNTCTLSQEWKTNLKEVMVIILDFMHHWWQNRTEKLDILADCGGCAMQLAVVLRDKPSQAVCQYVVHGVQMGLAVVALGRENEEQEGSAETLQKTITLQRRKNALVEPTAECDLLTHNIVKEITDYKTEGVALLEQKKDSLLAIATKDLLQKKEALVALQHGMAGGVNWLDGFTASDFDGLLEHASKTLLSHSAAPLSTAINELEEASSEYKAVYGCLEGAVNDSLLQVASETMAQAYRTKSTGAFLAFYHEVTDLADLRNRVQAEVKALRTRGLSEKTSLHPLLCEKISKTLRGKF
eukprot:5101341-Amphidinium_carterae.2